MMPIMTSALRTLRAHEVARGSTLLNIVQQIASSVGVAVYVRGPDEQPEVLPLGGSRDRDVAQPRAPRALPRWGSGLRRA